MTESERIEDALLGAVGSIDALWDEMLTPHTSGSVARSPGLPPTLADDNSDTEADTPRLERLLSLRREVTECLNGWARVIVEDRHLQTNLPSGTDTRGLCALILRHARWFSGHEAAPDAVEELRGWAGKVRSATFPARKDWLTIGECPVAVGAEHIACGTQVRVYPNHPGEVTCRGCGTTDTIDGWVLRMVGTEGPFTAAQLITVLHRRMGIVVKESAIRQWVARGVIEPVKLGFVVATDDSGRHLFDPHDVMARLARRERRAG